MKFVILGNVCIDKNSTEKISYKAPGGPITFMSVFFNQIKNSSVTAISSYGKDFSPYKKGLKLYPIKPNVSKTLVYENTTKNGKRSQKCYFYNENPPVAISKDLKQVLSKADVLFIAPLLPNLTPDYIKKVASLTKKGCLKILLPQGYFRNFDKKNVVFRKFNEADSILPLVDFVILSGEDYPNIGRLALSWAKKYEITIIITQAEKGAAVINKNGKVIVPTSPVPGEKIVDSVGAGDIFSASFGYYYLKNKDLTGSVKFANKIAGQTLFYPSAEIKININ